MEEPTNGEVLYDGIKLKDFVENEMHFLKKVQTVQQNPFSTFNPFRKVEDYLFKTVLRFKMANTKDEALRLIEEKLSVVGLNFDEIKGRYPSEFSGGQLQRISIARALLTNPSFLVADEPVSMIDASLRISIVNLFRDLKERFGISILYITHDLSTAYYVADKLAIMFRGSIVEMGRAQDILDTPFHPYTKLLKSSIPVPDPEYEWDENINLSSTEREEFFAKGCKFASRCPEVMSICRESVPPDFDVNGRVVKCWLYK